MFWCNHDHSPAIQLGSIEPIGYDHPSVFAFKRALDKEEIVVVCNFYPVELTYEMPMDVSDYKVALANYNNPPKGKILNLRPYEAVVYRKDK